MIVEIRETAPIIHFGFLFTKIDSPVGFPVKVWQNTLYNKNGYQVSIKAPGGGITKISDNEFEVLYTTTGNKVIDVEVISGGKKDTIKGNTINVTII
ncbi:hypothetical protein Q765_03265 [Flavobacterium rivuli WB 3.3-2 = DSM 21788]|uniref:Uncharacterized protein n=1 Tax=Flavobacterium rivuli WB 3.3-2 = DSM 21788 TaxID=1121895 RepID=A0A0A2M5Z3_9FLAO|nr:hypothetical protein [Flavobacterium rivuli]KGO88087.1 hypothetical protein Q765_03265 [Flavobacterium rivuli WB 3.3-2 = DSM 21788]